MIVLMKPYRIKLRLSLLILIILANTACVMNRDSFRRVPPEPFEVFDETAAIIEKNYIDKSGNPVKLDTSRRPDIATLVAQTDASTTLRTPEDLETMTNPAGGAIGVALDMEDGAFEIKRSFPGSPAWKAGLRRGDKIREIDGTPTAGLPISKVIRLLQGRPGSEVVIKTADKPGKEKTITSHREVIPLQRTAAERLIGKDIGYIRIEMFWPATASDVRAAMKRMRKKNIKSLVIDLRENSGGTLDSITGVAELFLKKKERIVTLDGRFDGLKKDFQASKWFPYTDFPIDVLIDGKTSTGAEILAAALRDNKRARLVGEKTAGVGDIRTLFILGDGSQIYLRTALAYTPTGEPIDGQGVKPDKEVALSQEEKTKLYQRMESFPDLSYADDPSDVQLKAAVAILSRD